MLGRSKIFVCFITNQIFFKIICENTAPHLAGHTASVVGDFMLVFGGSMGSSYNNNIYVLDIQRRIWNMPLIPGFIFNLIFINLC